MKFLGSLINSFFAWLMLTFFHSVPKTPPGTDKRAAFILAQNWRFPYINGVFSWPPVEPSSTIHKIDIATVIAVIKEVEKQCAIVTPNVDPNVVLAIIIQESACDPFALNLNRGKWEPNATSLQQFSHTDVGLGQIDGKNLLVRYYGLNWPIAGVTPDQTANLAAKAYSMSYAISYIIEHFLQFDKTIDVMLQKYNVKLKQLSDKFLLACDSYNDGIHGSIVNYEVGKIVYGNKIVSLYNQLKALQTS